MDEVVKAMREAAALFRTYERHHRDEAEKLMLAHDVSRKATDRLAKAKRNAQMAAKLEDTLARIKDQSHGL